MDVSGYATCMSTNGFVMQEIAPYPERMYLECNVGPVLRRGVKHAIWELEHLVKNCNAKLCKVYQPEDDGPLNDPRMWPFYEKACELGVPLTIHTGMAYVMPQPTKYTLPILLDDILIDFPDLKIIAYHMGWPYHEELFGLAGKHKNLYVSMSGIIGWFERAPYRGYHMLGEALQWAGPDKIVMGLDLAFDDMPPSGRLGQEPEDAGRAAGEVGLPGDHGRDQGEDPRPHPRQAHQHRADQTGEGGTRRRRERR